MVSIGLIVVIALVCASIFVNGWTDAPNAIATVVSTRVLSPKFAVGLAAVFNFVGVFTMGTAVAKTIGNMIVLTPGTNGLITLAAAQVAIVLWAVGAWKFGIPTSESHALIAGLTGAALAHGGLGTVSWVEWQKVLIGLGVSSILGFISGYIVTVGVSKSLGKMNRKKANRFFSIGQIVSASAMAFSHGAQDGQKFIGVLAFGLMLGGVLPMDNSYYSIPWFLMAGCSIMMAIGTSIGGYRIIKTMGMDMVKIEKYQGFSAEVAASACMISATAFGIPLSTTNSKGTAIMGAAAARRLSNVNWGVVKEMFTAWILTFPACGLIGYLMALLFHWIFQA
jgi:PiT family inorganic phosphate transporter